MREIRIPAPDWDDIAGVAAIIPVKVDWPELRLTDDQIVANAVAMADGADPPFPDHSFFTVRVERPGIPVDWTKP